MARQDVETEGIVLRSIKYGEADRIINCFTRSHGRIGFFVKNAGKRAKQLGGAIEPITLSQFRFAERANRELLPLKAAETTTTFYNIRASLSAIALASYWLELVQQLTAAGQPEPTLFRLLTHSLSELDRDPRDDRWDLLLFFEVHLLRTLGFGLVSDHCLSCGSDITAEMAVIFSGDKRGVTACVACAPHAPLDNLQPQLLAIRHAEMGTLTMECDLRAAESITRNVIHHLVGRKLKSEELLNQSMG